MAKENLNYAFYSDYSDVAACLRAMHQAEVNGEFSRYPELFAMLRLFELDVLKKLYIRSIYTLAVIDGQVPAGTGIQDDFFYGDFGQDDFIYDDFYVGFLDFSNTGYSAIFQSILQIFEQIKSREVVPTDEMLYALDSDIIAVLTFFWQIQAFLEDIGLELCAATSNADLYNNSGGVYLQAAGSDGQDGIARGIHLRWSFTEELGSNHLPKGDYHNGSRKSLVGFNQPNDYVQVFRAVYNKRQAISLDLITSRPVVNVDSKSWIYILNNKQDSALITQYIRVYFEDWTTYLDLAKTLDPIKDYSAFINQYKGILRIEFVGETCFYCGVEVSSVVRKQQSIKIEFQENVHKSNKPDDRTYAYRSEKIAGKESTLVDINAENIRAFRVFKSPEIQLNRILFETYADFLRTRTPADWVEVERGFALSTEEEVVFDRLEHSNYPIDNLWPQYNDGMRVRSANYQNKWTRNYPDEPSLESAVSYYLRLSTTDPRAEEILNEDTGEMEGTEMLISYLDMLNLQATDYHIARMLGLGHIDALLPESEDTYIYQLRYTNRKRIDSGEKVMYRYTTLPTSRLDKRIPEKPKMRPISYAFPEGDTDINKLLDESGYHNSYAIRVVNIGREALYDEVEDNGFFDNLDELVNYNTFETPLSVSYGIKYRSIEQQEYVRPDITHEKDVGGQPYYAHDERGFEDTLETVPVLDNESSLYIHFEQSTGVHAYAIYGINWFGRSSPLSDEVATDYTEFVPVNRLVAPSNIGAQYIQEEDALIFSTATEQGWLMGREQHFEGEDICLTRVTFDWMDIIDVSGIDISSPQALLRIPRADTIEAVFLDRMPMEISGRILRVTDLPGKEQFVRLYVGPYQLLDGTWIEPLLDMEHLPRFSNSILSCSGDSYRVEVMERGEQGLEIVVEKRFVEELLAGEGEEEGAFGPIRKWLAPTVDGRIVVVENLGNPENWSRIESTISLVSLGDEQNPVIETQVDQEGNVTQYLIGGVFEKALVEPLFGRKWQRNQQTPGVYKITFSEYVFTSHPQLNIPFEPEAPSKNAPGALHVPHVEWYRGQVRLPRHENPDSLKELTVLRIEQEDPLVLYVYDPDYEVDPIMISLNGEEDKLLVNFHPGYRAYFFMEPLPNSFNRMNIEPQVGENDRRTLISLQSKDLRLGGSKFSSELSSPVALLARKVEKPQPLEVPYASSLRVRPDATAKAAFTFEVTVPPNNGMPRQPFGFMFFRTDQQEVLDTLYLPETRLEIEASLSALTHDPFYSQRYLELVNLIFDENKPGHFKVYPAEPHPYGFPVPDRKDLRIRGKAVDIKIERYRLAIQQTLMPLTEQPPIFTYIKEGMYTENEVPVIRDVYGNLLPSDSPQFNPFPMVRKFKVMEDPTFQRVRFTDYTLAGTSRFLYFYAAVEIDNQLRQGKLSPFVGPVTVIESLSTVVPQVIRQQVDIGPRKELLQVHLVVAAFSSEERISAIRMYRFQSAEEAESLQNGTFYADVPLGEYRPEGYTVSDFFWDMEDMPYGKVIYYRVVGIRYIQNEYEEEEAIFTAGSPIVEVVISNPYAPQAPFIQYDESGRVLRWNPVGTSFSYGLYRMTKSGQWENIYRFVPPISDRTMSYHLPNTQPAEDEEGNRLYYRYKVKVENDLGFGNLIDEEITV